MDNAANLARHSLLEFLQKTRFPERFPPRGAPPAVETKVREIARSWDLDISEEAYEQYLLAGLDMAYASYPHTPHAFQIANALFTFCAVMFDEAAMGDVQAMREFIPRFCAGQPQLHPILTRLIETTGALREFLPEYTANIVYPSLLSYVNEELYCRKGADELTLQPDSRNYIEYSRFKSGMPELYAACIWPRTMFPDVGEYVQALPEAFLFLNYVNDFMSFYKEVFEGETDNYVDRYMRVHGKTLEESISVITERIVEAMERARQILGEGRAREAWEDFAAGYVHFHLYCPRYRLKEVIPEYF